MFRHCIFCVIISEAKILKKWLEDRKKIVITTHQKPDADALGSSLGLCKWLQLKGHDVKVISPTNYPNFLKWMPGCYDVLIYNDENSKKVEEYVDSAELIFCLDFSGLNRIKEMEPMVRKSKAKKILIDHHLEPEEFADFTRWNTEAAATCELVYELICDIGDSKMVNKDIANCLYAGIMTDTGNFKHPNVTENVFRICADLISQGAETSHVASMIYDTSTLDRLHLLGYALKEKLVVLEEYNSAYISLTYDELRSFNFRTGDTEGLVNYALSIKGIKVAALFSERPGIVKLSFRSVGNFSVNEMARKYFNGGGHQNAAGGMVESTLGKTVEKFKSVLKEYKSQLK